MPVLPSDDWVIIQVRDVNSSDSLGVLLKDQPSDMAIKKAELHGVGILHRIDIAVMCAMVSRPPSYRALDGTSADKGQKDLDR